MAVENNERLKAAGPIDASYGFPLWFEDRNGLRLELGLNPDPLTPAIGELPQPGAPLSFPDNFPDESFYFMAEASLPVGGNGVAGRARVVLALEAAFAGAGVPKAGLNVVFARIRVRMDDLIPGAKYTVVHPYGVTEPLEADDRGRVFYTEDLGIVEGDPTAVLLRGQVAPFLRGISTAPEGYIGDGATEQRVTGSPFNTNFVTIEGPRIREGGGNADPADPFNQDRVWTDRFTVQGRIARRIGARVEGATYARTAEGGFLLSVQAGSTSGQDLRLVGTGVHFKLDGQGEFYTGLGQAASLPNDAQLVNVSDRPPTRYPVQFTDLVIAESAIYDRSDGTLTIEAHSSDPGAALTVPQLGLTLNANLQSFSGLVAVPAEIIVQSDRGGAGRQRVEVKGTIAPDLPIEAMIAPASEAFAGELVTLDGSGSLGATGFAWSQTGGTSVILSGADTATATFTPPAAGDYTFTLTVQGSGGPAESTITLSVKPALGPDTLTVTRCEYRTGTRQFRVEGTVNQLPNTVVVKFRDQELGKATADIDGAWSLRRVLLESEAGLVPAVGETVQLMSKHGTEETLATIRIRN